MAYTSRAWVSQWSYDPAASDFNAKVGTILAGPAGQYAQTHGHSAFKSAAQPATTRTTTAHAAAHASEQTLLGNLPASPAPPPGYVWVNAGGSVLASTACIGSTSRAKAPDTVYNDGLHDKARTMAALNPADRSMLLWKTVSPGMMPGTSNTPISTNQDTYTPDPEALTHVDWTHHLQKTDFSAYLEAAANDMKHIATGSKK